MAQLHHHPARDHSIAARNGPPPRTFAGEAWRNSRKCLERRRRRRSRIPMAMHQSQIAVPPRDLMVNCGRPRSKTKMRLFLLQRRRDSMVKCGLPRMKSIRIKLIASRPCGEPRPAALFPEAVLVIVTFPCNPHLLQWWARLLRLLLQKKKRKDQMVMTAAATRQIKSQKQPSSIQKSQWVQIRLRWPIQALMMMMMQAITI
mmetsp:Transcript_18673/g.34371  ORF Transcript_18673/g.34371 Transcript_18673/m.34371 type:complete len:202 (+) Transcript_18673:391-996(+)